MAGILDYLSANNPMAGRKINLPSNLGKPNVGVLDTSMLPGAVNVGYSSTATPGMPTMPDTTQRTTGGAQPWWSNTWWSQPLSQWWGALTPEMQTRVGQGWQNSPYAGQYQEYWDRPVSDFWGILNPQSQQSLTDYLVQQYTQQGGAAGAAALPFLGNQASVLTGGGGGTNPITGGGAGDGGGAAGGEAGGIGDLWAQVQGLSPITGTSTSKGVSSNALTPEAQWLLNWQAYSALPGAMKGYMDTMQRMASPEAFAQAYQPVAKTMYNDVINQMANRGILSSSVTSDALRDINPKIASMYLQNLGQVAQGYGGLGGLASGMAQALRNQTSEQTSESTQQDPLARYRWLSDFLTNMEWSGEAF